MGKVLYYLVIVPLSRLPFSALYLFSDFLKFVLYRIAGYRRKVVFENLHKSFPEKSDAEIKSIASRFYTHFFDLLVESIKLFGPTTAKHQERYKLLNPEVINQFADDNRSVVAVSGHYNNWEMFSLKGHELDHASYAIYKPLKSQFWNKIISQSRTKNAFRLLAKAEVKPFFESNPDEASAVYFLSDQSPTFKRKAYWMEFLNQDTPVMYGVEKYAKDFDWPVVYAYIRKPKRGFYEITFEVLESNPAVTSYGEITQKHVRILEEEIRREPAYWLWTHKRWKRKRTEEEKAQGVRITE